jgi:hypothetical protein
MKMKKYTILKSTPAQGGWLNKIEGVITLKKKNGQEIRARFTGKEFNQSSSVVDAGEIWVESYTFRPKSGGKEITVRWETTNHVWGSGKWDMELPSVSLKRYL